MGEHTVSWAYQQECKQTGDRNIHGTDGASILGTGSPGPIIFVLLRPVFFGFSLRNLFRVTFLEFQVVPKIKKKKTLHRF